jgi:hypothetical protein
MDELKNQGDVSGNRGESDSPIGNQQTAFPAQRGRLPRRTFRLLIYLAGVILAVGLVSLAFWLATASNAPQQTTEDNQSTASNSSDPASGIDPTNSAALWQRTIVTEDKLADHIGVRITQVVLSGNGGLIDLRFLVLNPQKAEVLHEDSTPFAIVDNSSGLVANDLLMGHSHTGTFEIGHTYYLIFENPGNVVQAGSLVNVLLGNVEVDNVSVQ